MNVNTRHELHARLVVIAVVLTITVQSGFESRRKCAFCTFVRQRAALSRTAQQKEEPQRATQIYLLVIYSFVTQYTENSLVNKTMAEVFSLVNYSCPTTQFLDRRERARTMKAHNTDQLFIAT
jgi:hypothetical protein